MLTSTDWGSPTATARRPRTIPPVATTRRWRASTRATSSLRSPATTSTCWRTTTSRDAFKLSFEGTYARTQAKTYDYYIGTYGQPITLDNPFVPTAISNAAVAAGQDFVTVSRDNIDFGRHGESDLRQTYRAVLDAGGRINAHASYDAYYEYGETDVAITKLNELLAAPYAQALGRGERSCDRPARVPRQADRSRQRLPSRQPFRSRTDQPRRR